MSHPKAQFSLQSITATIGASALMLGILLPTTSTPANAIDLGDGRTFFESSPRLIRSATSNSSTGLATYQFTITIPEDAGESLQAVTITQKSNLELISFDMSESSAFKGDSFAGGSSLTLANIGGNTTSESEKVTVMFDQPVQPGNTVTISLRARNPQYSGIYQFGVTAFPVGQNSSGLYLGTARLNLGK